MRKIIALALAAAGTLTAGAVIAAAAVTPAGAAPARVAADTAQPCAQLPGHTAYVCITTDAFQGPWSADYWMDEAYMRVMAWHPADGDLAVSETYFCRPGTVSLGSGHVNSVDQGETFEPGATIPDEQWCERGAPGIKVGAAQWQARVITVADGCVVWQWKVTDTQEPPPAPRTCLSQFTGKLYPMPKLDQVSVLEFWRSEKLEPGAW